MKTVENKTNINYMNDFKKNVYTRELKEQCDAALFMAKNIDNSKNPLIFKHLHYFVIHAAMISKFIWPSVSQKNTSKQLKELATQRSNFLCKNFGGNIKHLRDKKIRNHLEHFDARLDAWAINDFPYIKDIFVPIDKINLLIKSNLPDDQHFNIYDANKHIYKTCGDIFNVKKVSDEIVSIKNKAQIYLDSNKNLT